MSPVTPEIYNSAKRSRTKPIRNADGILIRKDGRPHMRSQSSAANLRKVHAKKEEERLAMGGGEAAADGTTSAADSPAPSSINSPTAEAPNTQERSDQIMKQMFPKGLDQERVRLQTAQQYFPQDQSTDTAMSTPVQRTIDESEATGSEAPGKGRDDSPQQLDTPMKDAPAASSPTAAAKSAPIGDRIIVAEAPAPAPPTQTSKPSNSAPTQSPATMQPT
jgi:hypothetical protein